MSTESTDADAKTQVEHPLATQDQGEGSASGTILSSTLDLPETLLLPRGLFYRSAWTPWERKMVLTSEDFPAPIIIKGVPMWSVKEIWNWLLTKGETFESIRVAFARSWMNQHQRTRAA